MNNFGIKLFLSHVNIVCYNEESSFSFIADCLALFYMYCIHIYVFVYL